MAISKENIWAAANELDQAGEKPTLANVRKKVGGGSYTTISGPMIEWHATRAAPSIVKRDPLPQKVSDAASEFAAMVWQAADELANGQLMAERVALEDLRRQYEVEKCEAGAFADQLNQELDQLNQELETEKQQALELGKAHAVLAMQCAELQSSNDKERARAERLQAVSDEREKSIETLKEELKHVRADKERESSVAEVRLQAKQAELEKLNREHESEKQKALELGKAHAALAMQCAELKSGYEQERARAERLQAVSDEREKNIETLKEELKNVRADKERESMDANGRLQTMQAELGTLLRGKENANG